MPAHHVNIAFINHLLVSCLCWLAVLMFVFYGSDRIYFSPAPDRPAYDVGSGDRAGQEARTDAPAAAHDTLAERLHKADVKRGGAVFSQCALCHTAVENGPDRVGPNLWHVVGRAAAAESRFNYSRAMRNFAKQGHVWDFATLDAFLTAPAQSVPGTLMSFAGLENAQERADLLLYLNSLSDKPAALPEVESAGKDTSPDRVIR